MAEWRDLFDIHPAAEQFPLMNKAELEELAEDIEKNGLELKPTFITGNGGRPMLVDGRNRLDALERLGYEFAFASGAVEWTKGEKGDRTAVVQEARVDPYGLVLSLNAHRRHLSRKRKRELIEQVLRAQPEKSNNAIAKVVNVDDKTVAATRKKLEASSEIPKIEERVDRRGRRRPASRSRAGTTTEGHPEAPDASEAGQASPNGTEAAAEPIASLERSTPTTDGAAQLAERQGSNAEISEASSRERDEQVAALSNHLRRDPAGFLSDVAAIMADQLELLAIPERSRREAIERITRALGLGPQPEVKPDKPRPRTTHFVRRS